MAKKTEKKKPEGYVFGRPTKYEPRFCQMLINHMEKGLSFEAFGAITNTGKNTLYEWLEAHQDFQDAKRIAWAKYRVFWENLGLEHIISKTDTEKRGFDSNTKSRALNASVWIFNMKNRFKDEWKDRHEVQSTVKTIQINIDKDDEKL